MRVEILRMRVGWTGRASEIRQEQQLVVGIYLRSRYDCRIWCELTLHRATLCGQELGCWHGVKPRDGGDT
jgi:hypothetical protein